MTGVTLIEGVGKSSGVSHLCGRWQGLVGWEGGWPRQVASSQELSPEATSREKAVLPSPQHVAAEDLVFGELPVLIPSSPLKSQHQRLL